MVLTGASLTVADVEAVARAGGDAVLDIGARERMQEARDVIATLVAEGAVVYGVTTGFGSLHTGGAFYLMGDGSVRFINDGIDLATYRSLGAINDGGPIFDF